MVHVTSTLFVAALIAAPSFAAPISSEGTQFTAREFEDDLELAARTLAAGRVLTQTAGRAAAGMAASGLGAWGQNKAKEYLNQASHNTSPQVPEGLREAAKKASRPFSQTAVNAVTHRGHNKRDFEEFEARMLAAAGGRAAAGLAANALGTWGQNKAKGYLSQNSPPRVPAGLSDVAKKASGPFSQAAVNAVTHRGQNKRDLEEFDARTLTAAGGRAVAGTAAKALGAWGQSKANQYLNPPPRVPAGLSAAAKIVSGPHSQAAVDTVTGSRSRNKRDFDGYEFEERYYEDFEDILERNFDGLDEREYDDLEEREFFGLDELD
ncbi:hypothetical protein BDQ17DRAFT_1325246 [Cyathus striatus]|nr:hypothetical protein BDQ17DRAFT_1325246 [Cyathus striatus]